MPMRLSNLRRYKRCIPYGKQIQFAQRYVIYTYYMNSDTASTGVAAEHYIHLYPRDKYVDYAYYMKAMANFNQYRGFLSHFFRYDIAKRDINAARLAYKDFDLLIRYFPHSQYASDSRQHLIYLRNIFAKQNIIIARYYFDRRAYVAAANRANDVVKNYPKSGSVEEALTILIRSSRLLHLQQQANDALKVLKANFPQSTLLTTK